MEYSKVHIMPLPHDPYFDDFAFLDVHCAVSLEELLDGHLPLHDSLAFSIQLSQNDLCIERQQDGDGVRDR